MTDDPTGPSLAERISVAEVAGRFGALLHAAGLPVTPERSGRFAAALQHALPATDEELYWTARVTLLSGHDQVAVFDRVFAQLVGGLVDPADFRGDAAAPAPAHVRPGAPRPSGRTGTPAGEASLPSAATAPGTTGAPDPLREAPMVTVSGRERLRGQDFATLTDVEVAAVHRLVAQLTLAPPPRPSRRRVLSARGDRIDLRTTLARARRTGGDPHHLARRATRTRPRRLVLLCDISGSMEPYARVYLQLLHAAVRACRAEAFVFGTRLTRVTKALRTTSPDLALRQAGRAAPDWSGGTRIGEALRRFLDDHGRRGMARGALVVIVSDGWEHGDAALLAEQMRRLHRLAFRVVWVNPRSASPRYEPLVSGMAAALPFVDVFVSGHSLAALDDVVDAIGAA
ncbi:VWA domain-containing protein [Egicoccus sp. AB-alg2]|uniref:vWA domain-containing protein n=1 Tax=Egicoccus sp. AB-alg2 TaxID=3242693 RepID=UPI00359D97B2